jgi:hypothetical protein
MKILTTENIENLFWEESKVVYRENVQLITSKWNYSSIPALTQIYFWEEIYREKGNISLYAAYVPMIEFYLVVFELFQTYEKRYKIFYGKNSEKDAYEFCKQAGIDLITTNKRISESDDWLYEVPL